MKKIISSALVIAILSIFLFSSCEKKYEDGPFFSLRSKTSRLSGNWTIGEAHYNGSFVTTQYQALITEFDINKNGTYTIKGTNSDAGTWKFGEDKDDVTFTSKTAGLPSQAYHILRLKHKDLWLRQTETNGDILELHLK